MPVNPLGETFTGPTAATITPASPAPQTAASAVVTTFSVNLGAGTYTISYLSGRLIGPTAMPPAGLSAIVAFVKGFVETDQGWPPGSSTAT